ncbi:ribonuclease HII [Burkholderiaceae bacterium DAT-1]|nr:ribonuclease HII [Burkholderiaceae bacterium DAT-1]
MTTHLIAGVDEAGRGPLSGSVFAAAVILGEGHGIVGLADSKKLSEAARERLSLQIKERALAWAVASADAGEIDRLNILKATMLAMQRAVNALSVVPHHVQIDGNRCPILPMTSEAIVKGDAKVQVISAASILAKVARDAEAMAMDVMYPQFGFARHKGYPTPEHLAALEQFGPCKAHRQSFAPVRLAMGKCQGELW